MITITVIPKYNRLKSDPKNNQYMFQYNLIIRTTSPIQFIEYELKLRRSGSDFEVYADTLNQDRPYITDIYHCLKYLPSDSPYASLRGSLTFVDENSNIIEVEVPLTFFKAE